MPKYQFLFMLLVMPLALGATTGENNNNSANKFGFLGASLDDDNFGYLQDVGAGWLRPHPGPAVWEMMQVEDGGDYDWDFMDDVVTKAQTYNINLLITIWPFVAWDQVRYENSERCEVSEQDQFLPNEEASKKGRVEYLPGFRCNPYDWDEYERWVKAMVERYDGDGKRDMPKLTLPVRYWEVMNEPDLPGSDSLDFYKDGTDGYYKLLRRTALAIRRADKNANILIAGAASASTEQEGEMLNFYYDLFTAHPTAKKYFTIGNIHHISPESADDPIINAYFNVNAYHTMLDEFNINKPIWVTEAGAQGVNDADEQASLIKSNTKEAIQAGAKKIFFISYAFGEDYNSKALAQAKTIYKKLITKWN